MALYDQFIDEEQEWVSALNILNTAAYRDEIVGLRLRLETMSELLEEKWQGFLNDDGRLDEKERQVFASVYRVYRGFINDRNAAREKFKTALQAVGEAAAQADKFLEGGSSSETDLVKWAGAVIREAVSAYLKSETEIRKTLPTLEQYTDAELDVIVLFKETRKDTQLFIEKNGYDKMEYLYGEAKEELESSMRVGTSGQQDDTEVYVDNMLVSLSRHVSEGERIYKDFVSKHNLKFFGPIGPEIKEALAEGQVWLAKEEELRKLDIEEYLRKWRRESKEIIEVNLSLSGISEDERSRIKAALGPAIKEMDDTLTEANFARFAELVLAPLMASRENLEEELE